jgi:hypothetical protein
MDLHVQHDGLFQAVASLKRGGESGIVPSIDREVSAEKTSTLGKVVRGHRGMYAGKGRPENRFSKRTEVPGKLVVDAEAKPAS